MKRSPSYLQMDPIIKNALREDITTVDTASEAIFQLGDQASVELIAKQDGVLAGIPIFQRVFELVNPKDDIKFIWFKKEGDAITEGETLCKLKGSVQSLLSGERVALNFMQRLSGIATATRQMVDALDDPSITILDTRKTTPGLRLFEKYAVRVGGGHNHRYNLSDMMMLKDNHIAAVGSVAKAIEKARRFDPFVNKVEVEVESLDQVKEAVEAGADIIMLDNFAMNELGRAIDLIDGRALIECSGNISPENVNRYQGFDIDFISSGSITHSAGILDLSMKHLKLEDEHLKTV